MFNLWSKISLEKNRNKLSVKCQKLGLYVKYLHQNEEAGKKQQRGPLHSVQDDLKILNVCQNQKPERTQDSDPTWERTRNTIWHLPLQQENIFIYIKTLSTD